MTENTANTDVFNNAESFHAELAKINEPAATESTETDALEAPNNEDAPQTTDEGQESQVQEETEAAGEEEEEHTKGMIPKSRFFKENQKRKELERKYQEEHDALVKAQHELEMFRQTFNELMKPAQQEESTEEFDPIDPEAKQYVDKELGKIKQKQEELAAYQAQIEYGNALHKQQAEFEKDTPDFGDAYKHLQQVKYNEMLELGYSGNDAKEAAMQAIGAIAAKSFKEGKNVAEVAYKLAKTYGYAPKSQKSTAAGPNLEAIERNMPRSKSVTSIPAAPAGGVNTSSYMTAEGMQSLQKKTGAIDPTKFQEALKRIQANSQYTG